MLPGKTGLQREEVTQQVKGGRRNIFGSGEERSFLQLLHLSLCFCRDYLGSQVNFALILDLHLNEKSVKFQSNIPEQPQSWVAAAFPSPTCHQICLQVLPNLPNPRLSARTVHTAC